MSIDLQKLKPSASMELTRLANAKKEAGEEVYTLSIGDTHFAPPLVYFNQMAYLPNASSHYSSGQGLLALREAISVVYPGFNPQNVVMVPGLKQGFYYALEALGKKLVAVLEPAWLGYQATCVLAGCDYLAIDAYQKDWLHNLKKTDFEVLMFCLPNNPDGRVFTVEEVEGILQVASEKGAWLIIDIIYEKYSFSIDIIEMLTPVYTYPKLIIGNGFSKSHAMTGHRLGYLLTMNRQVVSDVVNIQQNLATCASTFAQYLVATEVNPKEISEFRAYYAQNMEEVLRIFPEWEDYKPQGGFYYFPDLRIYGIDDAKAFCYYVMEAGIALVPGSAYGSGYDSYVRISYSLDRETLIKGLKKLKNLINEYYA